MKHCNGNITVFNFVRNLWRCMQEKIFSTSSYENPSDFTPLINLKNTYASGVKEMVVALDMSARSMCAFQR